MSFEEHLFDRGLRPWHRVGVDLENETVTFSLYLSDGKQTGYQRYNWNGEKKGNDYQKARYYTYTGESYKGFACYGFDNCFGHGPIYVCEGIWDSIRINNCFHDSLAVLTATPSPLLKRYLRDYADEHNQELIYVQDNDPTGKRGGGWCDEVVNPPNHVKDVNELSQDECMEWLHKGE